MEKKHLKKKLEQEFEWLLDLGYSFRVVGEMFVFEKEEDGERIGIIFTWSNNGDYVRIYAISAFKAFDSVENIIKQATEEIPSGNYTIKKTKANVELPEVFHKSIGDTTIKDSYYLSNDYTFKAFSQEIEKFFHDEALPFFDQFSSLTDIVKWINETDVMEHHKTIATGRNDMLLRKLAILKQANSPSFKPLLKEYEDYLAEQVSKGDGTYIKMNEDFMRIRDYFEA